MKVIQKQLKKTLIICEKRQIGRFEFYLWRTHTSFLMY